MFQVLIFIFNLNALDYPKMDFKKFEVDTLKSPWIGYVTGITGKVFINRYNEDGTKIMYNFEPEKHTLIHQKDEINVSAKSRIDVLLKNENTLTLSSNTVFKIYKHEVELTKQQSLYSLLWGTVKATVNKLGDGSDYRMDTPNSSIGVRGTEFVAQYNGVNKTSKVACIDGLVSVKSVIEPKENIIREQLLKPNQYMKVETIAEAGTSVNQVNEPKYFSKKILTGINVVFDTDEEQVQDVWNYTELSTSYLRFGLGVKSASVGTVGGNKTSMTPLFLTYSPLFHLHSFLYLEPVFDMTLLSGSEYFIKGSANLAFLLWKGFYLFGGAGLGTTNNADSKNKPSLGINFGAGYMFAEKYYGFIDGLRLSYEMDSIAKDVYSSYNGFEQGAITLSLVFNLQEGRNRW